MKFLFVGLNYAPEPVGIGPYTTGLAEGLVARGHAVSVVAGKPYYPQWRSYSGFENGGAMTREENGVVVTRVPHYIPANPSGARRIAHHASFSANALGPARALARARPDIVLAVAPALVAFPVAAKAARMAGAPLWLHIQDLEVEAAIATDLLKPGSMAARAAGAFERRMLRKADLVSTISPQMCGKLAEKGVAPGRIFELRNWSNATLDFGAADDAKYRRRWGLGNRKVALYSGNIANKQGLEIVIDAARALAHRRDIAFVVCGEGPNRARLEAQAAGLDNIHFGDLEPVERMADFLSVAHLHLLPQVVGAADLVLPSKLTNMLASGRPVVATAAAETGLYKEVQGCGINTPPGDAAALAGAVETLVDNPALAAELGAAAARRARERWSGKNIIDAMATRARALVAECRG